MNKLILASILALGLNAVAADNNADAAKNEDKTTTSTNLMGTKTTTRKVKKHKENQDGSTTDVKVTDETKQKKNGEKTESVDAEKTHEKK